MDTEAAEKVEARVLLGVFANGVLVAVVDSREEANAWIESAPSTIADVCARPLIVTERA